MGSEINLKPAPEGPIPIPLEILAQLDRILESAPFRTSKRCSDLLRHVVHAACEGHLEFLKERTLGVAVFDRDPEYDTNQDPVVRNTAGQVRKRLAQYYCELGRDQELRIDLPPGAYVPQIRLPEIRSVHPLNVSNVEAPPVEAQRARWLRHWRVIVATSLIVSVGAVTLVLMRRTTRTNVDLFWAPMLKQPGAIVLCVGQGHTYKLKGNRDRLFEGNSESTEGFTAPIGSIPLSDLVPIWDRAIGINDAQTLVRLTALFAGFGRTVEFRGGRSTSLRDLRGKSTVLIGAFNNSWTLSLTGELPFYFDEDVSAKTYLVRDRLHPDNRAWRVRGDQQDIEDHEDYAIVSRVFNPTTEQVVIVAAGIKGGGTAAAGEFLTNVAYLGQALQSAPADWQNRNMQFVLKTRLLGGAAGPPQVIAAHYW
jgi:hypothetical protein